MKASEIMTKAPRTCSPRATAREVAQLMIDHDTGVIPIVEDGGSERLVGLVTDRDIATRLVAKGSGPDTPIEQAMSRDVKGVSPGDDVKEVRRLMEERKVRRVPVCDDQGRCMGIISQADLALEDDVSDKAVGRLVESVSEPAQRRH